MDGKTTPDGYEVEKSDDKQIAAPFDISFLFDDDERFPLLKLPYLALRNVVHQIPARELVDMAFCSKKGQRIVQKLAGKRLRATLIMKHFWCDITFPHQAFEEYDFYHINRSRGFQTDRTQAITRNEPLWFSTLYRWKNLVEGCLYFSGHFITMFGTEAIEVMHLKLNSEADLVLILDWLQKWKPTIRSFEVIGEDDSVRVQGKLVESLLQNLNVTENLKISIPSRNCTVTRKLTLKSFHLASTCTFDSMLNIDSENVEIGGISCEDLNKLLLNWTNGGFQKLKTLGAKFKLDWAVLTNGITGKRFRNVRSVTYFSMENINGVKATIKIISANHTMNREKIEFMVQQQQPDVIEL